MPEASTTTEHALVRSSTGWGGSVTTLAIRSAWTRSAAATLATVAGRQAPAARPALPARPRERGPPVTGAPRRRRLLDRLQQVLQGQPQRLAIAGSGSGREVGGVEAVEAALGRAAAQAQQVLV